MTDHAKLLLGSLVRTPLAQGRIGSNPVGLGNLILTQGANIHLG